MRRLGTMLCLVTLALSASGCGTARETRETRAALTAAAPAEAPSAAIRRKLAPACPTPTRWTRAERIVVATFIGLHAETPAMQLLAPEWERLNDGAKICRGGQ